MEVEEEVRKALVAMSAVTALTGSGTAARIRPNRLHKGDLAAGSCIVIDVDQESQENDLEGDGGLTFAVVNISCRALQNQNARALAEAVKFNGTNPGTGLNGYGTAVTTFHAVLDSTATGFVPRDDDSDQGYYTVDLSYTLIFTEQT